MRILLTASQVDERKKREKLKRHAKYARAIAASEAQWFVDLMAMPLDARIGRVASQVSRGFTYSRALCNGVTMTLERCSEHETIERGFSVTLRQGEAPLTREVFATSTRAAGYFLALAMRAP